MFEANFFFPSVVYRASRPEFLAAAENVVGEYIAAQGADASAPVCQSGAMFDDRISGLLELVTRSAFDMLGEQGFDLGGLQAELTEVWGQQFTRNGRHDEHVHGQGSQMTGFYFVAVPEGGALPMILDPRPAKRQINLVEKGGEVSFASERVVINVQPGDLLMFNSWLPHAFTPHAADTPARFIHFNVATAARSAIGSCVPLAEVV